MELIHLRWGWSRSRVRDCGIPHSCEQCFIQNGESGVILEGGPGGVISDGDGGVSLTGGVAPRRS